MIQNTNSKEPQQKSNNTNTIRKLGFDWKQELNSTQPTQTLSHHYNEQSWRHRTANIMRTQVFSNLVQMVSLCYILIVVVIFFYFER